MSYQPTILGEHQALDEEKRIHRCMQYAWLITINQDSREAYSILQCIYFLATSYIAKYPDTELGILALVSFKVAYAMMDQTEEKYLSSKQLRDQYMTSIPGLRSYPIQFITTVEKTMVSEMPINLCTSYYETQQMSFDEAYVNLIDLYEYHTGWEPSYSIRSALKKRVRALFG